MFRTLVFALSCALTVGTIASPASSQTGAGAITLSGVAIDTADDNRLFTRRGGAVRDDVTFAGLTPGQPYTLAAQLHEAATGAPTGDIITMNFKPEAADGSVSIELPVPPNRTDFNIDYLVALKLYDGDVDAASASDATPLVELSDASSIEQTIQVHSIQRLAVTAADAADGDRTLPGEGGVIAATVAYENLVPGYKYTIWGQLMTPSGQSTGIFASIPEFVPAEMNGSVSIEFDVPTGFDGIRLVPSVGIYHKKRVSIGDNGALSWLPDAPNPVMIASDPGVDDPEKTIDVGTPFEELAKSGS